LRAASITLKSNAGRQPFGIGIPRGAPFAGRGENVNPGTGCGAGSLFRG